MIKVALNLEQHLCFQQIGLNPQLEELEGGSGSCLLEFLL